MLLSSCATLNNASQYQLRNDRYEFRQPGGRYTKVYVDVTDDTIELTDGDPGVGGSPPMG